MPTNIIAQKTIYSVTQVIPDDLYDNLEGILCGFGEAVEADEIVCFTALYPDKVEMDLKVVLVPDDVYSGNTYIDSVLFIDGHEVFTADIGESLEDVSVIDYDGTTYQFNIIKASVYNDFMSN